MLSFLLKIEENATFAFGLFACICFSVLTVSSQSFSGVLEATLFVAACTIITSLLLLPAFSTACPILIPGWNLFSMSRRLFDSFDSSTRRSCESPTIRTLNFFSLLFNSLGCRSFRPFSCYCCWFYYGFVYLAGSLVFDVVLACYCCCCCYLCFCPKQFAFGFDLFQQVLAFGSF